MVVVKEQIIHNCSLNLKAVFLSIILSVAVGDLQFSALWHSKQIVALFQTENRIFSVLNQASGDQLNSIH